MWLSAKCRRVVHNWLIFNNPFTFILFWVYFTCGVASVNRAPFDLAEAESELVAGFHTEYSGLRWSFFFMAEYGSMFLVSGLASVLFLGAWNGPIPLFGPEMLNWTYLPGATNWTLAGYTAALFGLLNLLLKAVFLVTVMMWVRWTLPRLRIDQVLTTCLKYCVPLAAFCFIGAVAWQLNGWWGLNDVAPRYKDGPLAVRESWQLRADREVAAKDKAAKEAAEKAEAEKAGEQKPAEEAPATTHHESNTKSPAAEVSARRPQEGEL